MAFGRVAFASALLFYAMDRGGQSAGLGRFARKAESSAGVLR